MQIGENIYKLRAERGLSQGALADVLEVSRQSVSKWENNTSVPELDKLIKMSKLFGVTLDELVYGVPEKKEEKTESVSVSIWGGVPPRVLAGVGLLLFGMVFFLFSVFWGDQLRLGEEFGELVSLSIVLISIAMIATYNKWMLAICAIVYFVYNVAYTVITNQHSLTNYLFMLLMSYIILIWFIEWGTHENKGVDFKPLTLDEEEKSAEN